MSIKKIFIISFIIGLLIPLFTQAQVKITEIMYDPEGSDTKREWIEVFNSGTTSVDLNTYFFFEGNVFHKLVAQTNSILEAGAYAIIVDSVAEVIADYTNFMGQLFDSTFSLNNTGEILSIANSSKEIIDTVTYSATMGANNNTHSLQIHDGTIITATPTFGVANKTESEVITEDEPDTGTGTGTDSSTKTTSTSDSTHKQQESVSKYVPPAQFKIGSGRNRVVSINTPIEFEAHVSKGDVSPKFLWNFGDFNTDKGKRTTHIYEYEGTYEVVLEGKTKEYTGISRTQVRVVEPELEFVFATTTISIQNKSKQEVNIGGFTFNYTEKGFFNVPRNTIIKGGAIIHMKKPEDKVLQDVAYPDGQIYQQFDTIEGVI